MDIVSNESYVERWAREHAEKAQKDVSLNEGKEQKDGRNRKAKGKKGQSAEKDHASRETVSG